MRRLKALISPTMVLVTALLPGLARSVSAQELADAVARGPRFLLASTSRVVPLDVERMPVLVRQLSLDLDGVTLKQALAAISAQAGLDLGYSDDAVPLGRVVHLRAEAITTAAALTDVLLGAGVDVVFDRAGRASLVRRIEPRAVPVGSVVGRVTDAKTGSALAGATVVVEGTSRSATTGGDGRYRIAEVAPGTYTVRARYIGYAPGTVSVAMSPDQEVTADFALEKSAQRLDEVVTTGTVTPTEVKALPTPITVITADDIERLHIRRVDEVVRLAVPGAVVWDSPAEGQSARSDISFRGASGLQGVGVGANNPKVLIDGIEVADAAFPAIDPASIERIEVIRGSQAAAIYGSGAMGGVIQVFTKRGTAAARPEIEGRAALGVMRAGVSPFYPLFKSLDPTANEAQFTGSNAIRQEYAASLRGQSGNAGYHLGGSYTKTGDWLPDYSASSPSLNAGLRVQQGAFAVDLFARYYQQTNAKPRAAPAFPQYASFRTREESDGIRVVYPPTSWWRNEVTVGLDRLAFEDRQDRPTQFFPGDTLLQLNTSDTRRLTAAYNAALAVPLASGLSANVTAGIDHYTYTFDQLFGSLPATTGAIPAVLGGYRGRTTNTGLFTQFQLNIRDAVFVTGAVRGEKNSDFGDSLGLQLSPRVGASYVWPLGSVTVKLRAAYGEATHPPTQGQKQGYTFDATSVQLPNLTLRQERQRGPDGGVDIAFGGRGSLSVTRYDQVARDLIQFLTVGITGPTANPTYQFQYQNVARVKNTGWEFEGTLQLGRITARGNFAVTHSRPEDLGPSYTGALKVGDQLRGIPQHTGAATISVNPFRGTSIAASIAYTGHWQEVDWLTFFGCGGGGPGCHGSSPSDYVTTYGGFTTVNVSFDQQITRGVVGYIGVEDVTNVGVRRAEENDFSTPGRVVTAGVRARY